MEQVIKQFEKMGAKVEISTRARGSWSPVFRSMRMTSPPRTHEKWPTIDIKTHWRLKNQGKPCEVFEIVVPPQVTMKVIDTDVKARHLLLQAYSGTEKAKFLCGHDERHWFVAAVPENSQAGVKSVRDAMVALQPTEVREVVRNRGLKPESAVRRKNRAYIRQGEWFFVPTRMDGAVGMVLHNEPINRGTRGSTNHLCEYLVRQGGVSVHVHPVVAPAGLSDREYIALVSDKEKKLPGWRLMTRDAQVYVKGKITHRDHATIDLKGWHRVFLNNEVKAKHARAVVFLD